MQLPICPPHPKLQRVNQFNISISALTASFTSGYAVTGGRDAVINIFDLQNPKDEPDFCLVGHSENICALDATPTGTIISGSWDRCVSLRCIGSYLVSFKSCRTAKVWKNFSLVFDLKAHQQSVWAVLVIEGDHFLTGE